LQDNFVEWKDGAYRTIDLAEMESIIVRLFAVAKMHRTRNDMREFIAALKRACAISTQQSIPFWRQSKRLAMPEQYVGIDAKEYVAFQNCILHLPSGKVLESTPFFSTFNARDFDYVANAVAPLFEKTLREYWPDVDGKPADEVALLQEIFGYMLLPETNMQRFFLWIGDGRNGKGVLVRILTALLGPSNVASLTMQELGSSKRTKIDLINKLAIIVTEGALGSKDDKVGATNYIKMICGEDTINIHRRNKAPWRGKLDARILLTANQIPNFVDPTRSLPERIVSLWFSRVFEKHERDLDLVDKLMVELPGIFCWAMEGYSRLKAASDFTTPTSSITLTDNVERVASPAAAFLEEALALDPEATVTEGDLYRAYAQLCRQTGTRPKAKGDIVRAVVAAKPGHIIPYRPHGGERALRGLKVKVIP
jgi:putative DNA primase/helicase